MQAFRFVSLLAVLALLSGPSLAAPPETWLSVWGHAPSAYNLTPPTAVTGPNGVQLLRPPAYAALPPYVNQTVREVARTSAAAKQIRIRFSNEFGAKALTLGAAHVALAGEKGAVVPGTDHVLTFAGKTSVQIPPGAPMLSDPLTWALPTFSKLAISVYYSKEATPPAHAVSTMDSYTAPGDVAGAATLAGAVAARNGAHVSSIDIVPTRAKRVVVAFGDSITEGTGSTPGAFRTWPDRLAERLTASAATRDWAVTNAGIGSNRLLHDTPTANALARFDRDVLAAPGAAAVIVLLGINDIQYGRRIPEEAVDAAQLIAAMRQLADRAHARGLRAIAATITAFAGSGGYSEQGEAVRQAVNQWIRTGGAFDGVADFDAATRDPARPNSLRAAFDDGGHLHPNDAGYVAMAGAIDLTLFSAKTRR